MGQAERSVKERRNELRIEIPAMDELHAKLDEIRADLDALKMSARIMPQKAWYNLREAAAIKGTCYNTLSSRRNLQPNGGVEDGIIGGARYWRAETIMEWINQTDADQAN